MGLTRLNSQDITDGQILKADLGVLSGKGSLVSYNGSAHVELGTGQSGYVLSVDPSTNAGLNWVAPGGADLTPYVKTDGSRPVTGLATYGLGISGGVKGRYINISSDYSVALTDHTIFYNSSSTGIVTVTLPDNATASGSIFYIQNESTGHSGLLCITGATSTDNINEGASIYLRPGERNLFFAEGDGNWDVLSRDRHEYLTAKARGRKDVYYTSPGGGTALSTATLAATRIYASPFIVDRYLPISGLAVVVTTTGTVNPSPIAYTKYAIYLDDGSGKPGKLWQNAQTNELQMNSLGSKKMNFQDNLPRNMTRGFYWLACATTGGGTPGSVRGFAVGSIQNFLGYPEQMGPGSPIWGWSTNYAVNSGVSFPLDFPPNPNLTALTGVPMPVIFVVPSV